MSNNSNSIPTEGSKGNEGTEHLRTPIWQMILIYVAMPVFAMVGLALAPTITVSFGVTFLAWLIERSLYWWRLRRWVDENLQRTLVNLDRLEASINQREEDYQKHLALLASRPLRPSVEPSLPSVQKS